MEQRQELFNRIQFLTGSEKILLAMPDQPALPTFSEEILSFLADLSRNLMGREGIRRHQDVMSYAYWIRKASLLAAAEKHPDRDRRMGRGIAFHIAPSNVPVNFAVSMTSAMLAGNACIVRVSEKKFEAVDIITDAINELLKEEHKKLAGYFAILRYPHDATITEYLSSICDVRIIWGGDATIRSIRSIPLPERAIELTFADRHSLALIDAKAYLELDAKEVAKGFYTDTYYSDQNACSSPRLVVWSGDAAAVGEARNRFWQALHEKASESYEMQSVQAVDKMTSFTALSMSGYPCRLVSDDNLLVRIEAEELRTELMDYKNGGGYFFEYVLKESGNLDELLPVLGKRCQTLAQIGFDSERLADFVRKSGVQGVDRIVAVGQTMALEFIWDGFRMIDQMSRYLYY